MTDDLFNQIAARVDSESQQTAYLGVQHNPDELASASKLAKGAGVPVDVAMDPKLRPGLEQQQKLETVNQRLQDLSPQARNWFTSDPVRMGMAHDDMESLSGIDSAFQRAKRRELERVSRSNRERDLEGASGVATSLTAKVVHSLDTLMAAPNDVQEAVLNATVGRVFGPGAVQKVRTGVRHIDPTQACIQWLGKKGHEWGDAAAKSEREGENILITDPDTKETFWNADAVKPWRASGLENIAGMVASEAAPMAVQIGATMATGGAVAPSLAPTGGRLLKLSSAILRYAKSPAGMIEVGRTVQGQYENGVRDVMERNPGMTEDEAKIKVAPGAVLAGFLSGPTGAAMEGKILDDLMEKVALAPGGKSLVKRWLSRLGSGAAQAGKEGSQEVVQGFAEDLAEWITYSPDKTLKEAAANAVMNFVGGAAIGGASGFAMHGAHVQENREVLDAVGQSATGSKLLQRAPEAFGEAISAMTENGEVGIPAEQFTTYFQSKGMDPVQMAAELKVKNLQEAMEAGTDVMLPVAEIAKLPEHFEALKEDIRLHPEDPTEREYREMEAAYQQEQDRLEAEAQSETQGQADEDLNWIQDDLTQKLVAIGTEKSTAEAYAAGEVAKWRTLAERTGISPRETYEQYGFTFSNVTGEQAKKSALEMVKDRLKSGGLIAAQMWQSAKQAMGLAGDEGKPRIEGEAGNADTRTTEDPGRAQRSGGNESAGSSRLPSQEADRAPGTDRLRDARAKFATSALTDPESVRISTAQQNPGKIDSPSKVMLQASSTLEDIKAADRVIPLEGTTPDRYEFNSDSNTVRVDGPNGEHLNISLHPHRGVMVIDAVVVPEGSRGQGLAKKLYRRASQVIGAAYPEIRWVAGNAINQESKGLRASYPGTVSEGDDFVTPIHEMMTGRSRKEPQTFYQSPKLSALHNLSAENLAFADKMGGLAVPSVAVVKGDMGIDGFGEITLIGGKNLADPTQNPVFDADAYAPRFPRPEYPKPKSAQVQKAYDALKPFAKKFGDERILTLFWEYTVNEANPEKAIRELQNSNMAKAAFLSEKGVHVEEMRKPARVEAPFLETEAWRRFQADTGWKRGYDTEDKPYIEKLSKAISDGVDEWVGSQKGLDREDADYLSKANKKAWLSDSGEFKLGREYALQQSIDAMGRMDVDDRATADVLNKNIEGRESEFKAWVDRKVLGLFGEPYLKQGRSKVPYTLENIVEAMSGAVKNQEKGMTFGEGAARAAASKQFRDLERMREVASRSILPEDQVSAAREAAQQLTEQYRSAVIEQFRGTDWRGEIDTWDALDASMRALAKMAKSQEVTHSVIRKALSSENFNTTNLSSETLDLAKSAVESFRRAPVPYFESKPQRAVALKEFSGAVLPESTSDETKAILEKHGIPWVSYANEAERAEATVAFRDALSREGKQVLFQRGGGRFANAAEKRAWRAKKAGQMTQASMDKAMTDAHEAEEAEFAKFEEEVLKVQAGDIHGGDQRGFIQIGADQKIHIGLLENRDLSTVLHELGHAWLEITADIAERGGTPDAFKKDFQALLDKLGVKDRSEITAEHHEKFAEWNEAYLLEGKAPSQELRGIFQRFKAWMKLVYGSLTGFGVKLSPEVRDFFDRLYASDREIEAAKGEVNTAPMFATAEDAGMTEAQFGRYTKAVQQQIESAREALDSQLLREAKREKEQWWKEEKTRIKGEVEREISAQPEYMTLDILKDESSEVRLSAAEVERQFGAEARKRLPRGATVAEGGMDAETAAEMLGYGSGAELVESLSGLEPKEKVINREVANRMREAHGDLRLDGTIADAAKEALHNESRETALMLELQAIKRLQQKVAPIVREAVGEERAKGKAAIQAEQEKAKALKEEARNQTRQAKASLAAVPKIETFRNAARAVVESTKVMDLKPYRYLLADRKHARLAAEAMAKGDHASAADAKSKQILNHCLFTEATKALDEVAKIRAKAKKGMGGTIQAMLGKAGKDYQEAYNALLARFSFDKVSNKAIQEENADRLLFEALNTTHGDAGVGIDTDRLPADRKNFKEATLSELRALKDALANIEHVARESNRVLVGKQKEDLDEAVAGLISTALKHNEAKPVKPSGSTFTATEKAALKIQGLGAHLKQMVRILDQLDGGDADGWWHRAIWQPISDAMGKEADLGAAVNKRLQEIIEKRGDFTKKYLDTSIGITLPGEAVPMNRRQAITFLLNLGTEENRNAMLGGYKLLQGDGSLNPIVDQILSNLTKEELTFTQDIWNVLESMWPAVEDLEMRLKGIAPKRKAETGFTVTTRDGETVYLKGGYFPQVGEPLDKTGKRQEFGDLSQIFEQGYTRATTNKSHTKQVTGATYRVNLDFAQVLSRHLPSVIKDITHREAVLSINRVLNRPEVSRVIQETMGPEYEAEFLPWLKGTVNNRNTGPQEPIFGALMGLKHRMVIAQLGFNLGSQLIQVADVGKALTEVPAKHLARAYADLARNPKQTVAMIRELSPNRMAHFEENYHRDLMQWFEAQDILERKKNRITEIGMSGFRMMGQLSAFPAWLGAYQQGMAEHGDSDKAVREADTVVDRVIQMGNPANLSRVMRDKGAMNLFTTFQGDLNIWFNILSSAVGEKNGKKLAKSLLAYFLSGIIGNLLVGRGPKDDEEWYEWAALKGLIGIPELVPFVGDLAKMGLAKAQGKPVFNQQFSPVFTAVMKPFVALGDVADAASGDGEWDDAAFSSLDAAGTFAGLPGTAQTLKTAKYLNRLSEGDEQPDHAGDVAMGVLFGKRNTK